MRKVMAYVVQYWYDLSVDLPVSRLFYSCLREDFFALALMINLRFRTYFKFEFHNEDNDIWLANEK